MDAPLKVTTLEALVKERLDEMLEDPNSWGNIEDLDKRYSRRLA